MVLVQHELLNAYIWIPAPTSITLDKSSINLTTVWQTAQLTATIEPTVSDHSITWTSSDTTVATVSSSWLVTCVTPWTATITATTSNGLTATCGVINQSWWQPWVNTLAYRPLESDANEYSGNYNWTISWTALTFSKVWWANVNSAFFASTKMTTSFNTKASTISFWAYKPSSSSDPSINDWKAIIGDRLANNGNGMAIQALELNKTTGSVMIKYNTSNKSYTIWKFTDKRRHICVTSDGSNIVVYANWTAVISTSWTRTPTTWLWLWIAAWDNLNSNYNRRWHISRVIAESVAWTQQEVQDYYNQTKWDYWIS